MSEQERQILLAELTSAQKEESRLSSAYFGGETYAGRNYFAAVERIRVIREKLGKD